MKKLIIYIFAILVFSIFFEQVCSHFYNQQLNNEITCTHNSPNQILEELNEGCEFIIPEKKQNFNISFSIEPQLNNYCFVLQKSSSCIWQPPEII